MATFAEIQNEIGNMLELADQDLTPDQQAAMDAYLDELGRQEADKIDSFGRFMTMENARIDATEAESKRLAQKAKSAKNRVNYLKARYAQILMDSGLKKVSGNIYSVSLRKSEKVEAPDTLEGLDALPDIYKRVKTLVEPDKTAIKESLKGGVPVKGCRLVESFSLQIR